MVLLIHHPVSPFGRKVRIAMSEKKMLFVLKEEDPWKLSEDVLKLNPAGELPIFISDGNVVAGNYSITEFLDEIPSEVKLFPKTVKERAEIRRIMDWFDTKFYRDVYRNIVIEKVHKRFGQGFAPDSKILKIGLNNLKFHLEYVDWLCERRNYIGGDEFSYADITASAHLSVIDYLGDVSWDNYRYARLWYSKIKSRPCFKDILKDSIRGILPSKNYSNLDF